MDKGLSIFVVDDDPRFRKWLVSVLEAAGHSVISSGSGAEALPKIAKARPDCVLVDLMMPEMDGLEFCRHLRTKKELADTKAIVISAKSYAFDKKRAMEIGADGYITKPTDPETLVTTMKRIIADEIAMTFWGVRGTLPVPGERSLRYGGNTSCVTLNFPKGQFFVFDAGTGIKSLSDHIMADGSKRFEAKIFISHPHWDHINALPFFAPLYVPGNEFEILGASHGDITMRELISAQMDGVYFPINLREFGSRVYFQDLTEGDHEIAGITVRTMLLSHPGNCLGYRVEYNGRSICYITDNELYLPDSPHHNAFYVEKLISFIRGTDALITDCTYTDEEYLSRVGWGHSAIGQVADLAHRAEVGTLYLFHHDPDQSDDDIDAKLQTVRELLDGMNSGTEVVAPAEKQTITL